MVVYTLIGVVVWVREGLISHKHGRPLLDWLVVSIWVSKLLLLCVQSELNLLHRRPLTVLGLHSVGFRELLDLFVSKGHYSII